MNYDLIIVKIGKPQIKQVLARHLAADPLVSLHKALSLLDNLPVIYMKDLSSKELKEAAAQLKKLGVECRAVESKGPPDTFGEKKAPQKKEAPQKEKSLQGKKTSAPAPQNNAPPVSDKKMKRTFKSEVSGPVTFSSAGSVVEQRNESKKAVKKKKPVTNILVLAGILIVVVIIIIIGRNKNYDVKSTGPLSLKSGKGIARGSGKKSKGMHQRKEQNEQQEEIKRKKQPSAGAVQRKSSEAYADSAYSAEDDYDRAIKFYKIAISFNRYNLRAWQGLIAAYTNAHRATEALEARKRMEELFDDTVLTVEKIVEPYGVLSQYNQDKKGTCRIEYRSRARKRSRIEKETYSLIRELISQQGCKQVSLFAATGRGSGMLVRIGAEDFPSRLSDYVNSAAISFVE